MKSFDQDAPTERISTPPLAASAIRSPKTRHSLADGFQLSQSEMNLPYRRSHPSAASLYASTLSPPGSRSQSPVRSPSTRATTASVFGGPHGNNGLALTQGAGDSPGDPLNLILKAFVPNVAVLTSADTDALLKEKGFDRGLWELLRPFGERVQGKVIIRDSKGSSRTYEDYSVHFVRFGDGIEPPAPTLKNNAHPSRFNGGSGEAERQGDPSQPRKVIDEVEAVVDRHLSYAEESILDSSQAASPMKSSLDLENPSPYFSLYLRRLLSVLPIAPHETFSHPVACVVAISSRNHSPIETLRQLYKDSSTGEKQLPQWVDPEFLRYYVLVHDEERDDITTSMSLFDQMKRNLGLHCHLLRIRGNQSVATDDDSVPLPRSEWMSAAEELTDIKRSDDYENFEDPTRYIYETDATAIRTFVREMVTQSIIPTMERHVSVWNDQVASKRRGMAGRFLGLTKRWGFGSSSKSSSGPGQSSGSSYDSQGFYRFDTPEAILRKLADYAFMLRDWKLAYSTYDILRGDHDNDKAWKHHAASNEMAAISMLIMPQNISSKTRTETIDTMFEAAFYSYQTRCTSPYGALRCIALGVELLRLRGGSSIDDAARWAMRLLESRILGPAGDALIKERLAVCYASKEGMGTQAWGNRRRKSGFWSIMGADAWVSQAKFVQAQRCLNEARKTYEDLPSGHGIDKFATASAFMLGIGQQLNEHLEAVERANAGPGGTATSTDQESQDSEDEETSPKQDEVEVDEESESLDRGNRRISILGAQGGPGLGLESAPLRETVSARALDEGGNAGLLDDSIDRGEQKDGFG